MAKFEYEVTVNNIPRVRSELHNKIYEALEVCGGTAERFASYLCPVGTEETTHIAGYKGGSLRSTIRHEFEGDDTVAVKAGGIDGIYKFVNYAVYVEMGTRKMKAQPYLKPAFEDHLDQYRQAIERALKG